MEKLSRDDQEQLDYINKWWAMKREKEREKEKRKSARRLCLSGARFHICRAVVELKQYFKLLLRME